MAFTPPEHAGEIRSALAEIVGEHGPDALSKPALLTSLLADLMPDAPRLARLMVAAAQDGIADDLRSHIGLGMDVTTAARLVTSSFASATLYTPEACAWVVGEFAIALGLEPGTARPPATAEPEPEATPDILPAEPGPRAAADVVGEERGSDASEPPVLRPDVTGPAALPPESPATQEAATESAGPLDSVRTDAVGSAARTGADGARPGEDTRPLAFPSPPAGEQGDILAEPRRAAAEPPVESRLPEAVTAVPGPAIPEETEPTRAPGPILKPNPRAAGRRRLARSAAALTLLLAIAAGAYAALHHPPATHRRQNAGGSPGNGCVVGYVRRNAAPGDKVCVTPAEEAQVRQDNSLASARINPEGGPYGPDTCVQGYVWRGATPADHVCVTPQTRAATAVENAHPHRSA